MPKHGGFGWKPDKPDPRDHIYRPRAIHRPPSVDLRPKLPPCWDQGQLGSCTAFALTGAVAFLHGFVGSQLWLYYKERVLEHDTKEDNGRGDPRRDQGAGEVRPASGRGLAL
jgi:hypothetical protein